MRVIKKFIHLKKKKIVHIQQFLITLFKFGSLSKKLSKFPKKNNKLSNFCVLKYHLYLYVTVIIILSELSPNRIISKTTQKKKKTKVYASSLMSV